MYVHPRKQDKLKKRLQNILKQENLEAHLNLIRAISSELDVTPLDLAAALLYVSQPHLFQPSPDQDGVKRTLPVKAAHFRNVRYHLSVGTQHKIEPEQLLEVIIAESGVDRKRITRFDMRDSYTLIDLPDGMPADIFQILNETMVGEHKLKIRRLKPNRKKIKDANKS
jgi:hypothetical protein